MNVILSGESEQLANGLIERLKAHSDTRFELGKYLAEVKEKSEKKGTYTAILHKAGIHPNVAAEHVTIHNYLEATKSRQAVFSYKHKQLLTLARAYKKDPDGDADRRREIDEFQAKEYEAKAKSIEPVLTDEEIEETIVSLKAQIEELEDDLDKSRENFLRGLSVEALYAEAKYLTSNNVSAKVGVSEYSARSGVPNESTVRKKLMEFIL